MPIKTTSFWGRLSGVFKKRPAGVGAATGLPPAGDDGLLLEPAELPELGDDGAESGPERSVNPLVRWSKREQTLARIQEGYERVNQVIEEIQKHLAQQGERTDRICTALEQLARSMGDVTGLGRQQAQTLESIAGNIEAGNARLGQLSESVTEIPKATRAQTETLHGIRRQLEVSGEQNLVTAQTMEKLSSAISTLGEANATQLEALRQMNRKADDQTAQLSDLVARQNRRFVMLFVVTLLMAVAAIVAVILGLALR